MTTLISNLPAILLIVMAALSYGIFFGMLIQIAWEDNRIRKASEKLQKEIEESLPKVEVEKETER